MKMLSTAALVLVAGCTVSAGTQGRVYPSSGPSAPSAPPPSAPPPAPVQVASVCADPSAREITDLHDQAMPLAPSSTLTSCLSRDDFDVLTIAVPPNRGGSIVRFEMTSGPEVATSIEVLDANRKRAHIHNARHGEIQRGWAHVAGGTSVFLRVSHRNAVDAPYTLVVSTEAVTEDSEPNDSLETATPLQGKAVGYLTRALNVETLEDWYSLDVTSGALTLTLDMSQGVSPRITVYDANRKRVAGTGGGRGERIQLDAKVRPGRYYIKLDTPHTVPSADDGDAAQAIVRPYTLTAT
jgi:hypothetical protein